LFVLGVSDDKSRILMKLHANDRTHAAMIGLKRGIIDL
jgi:DNA-binding NarL/FixJ family response regulator